MRNEYKYIVIGGGVSGVTFAITVARRFGGDRVLILEGSDRLLKKLSLTGNGQGNLSNVKLSADRYSPKSELVESVLKKVDERELKEFFSSVGIETTVKGDRIYPESFQASAVTNSLILELQRLGVETVYNARVNKIVSKDGYLVRFATGEVKAENVVCAFGGSAYKKLLTDGKNYRLLFPFKHSITEIKPAICRLFAENRSLRITKGVKRVSRVRLMSNGVLLREETGEIHFAGDALSGPAIFSLSTTASANIDNNLSVSIDLLPDVSIDRLYSHTLKKADMYPFAKVEELFSTLVHNALSRAVIVECGINLNTSLKSLSEIEIKRLCSTVKSYCARIIGADSFDNAQATLGGIRTNEVTETFKSKLQPNLYILGEALDVCGDCGGYNLHFAFASGIIAGYAAEL